VIEERSAARVAAAALIATRLPILLIGAVAVVCVGTVPPPTAEAQWRVSPDELVNLLARWDTVFYYQIATDGYDWAPNTFLHQNVVFFPLYPLLMRWGGELLGGHPLLAGLIVSLASFGGAVMLLYRLASLELGHEYAVRVVVLMSTFPYALFYSAVYTESLFLLETVGAFYAMRRGYLWRTAICGVAAGLTRPNGFWLTVPLVFLAVAKPVAGQQSAASGRSRLSAIGAACAPIVGMAIYSYFLHLQFSDPFAWVAGQTAWGMPLLGQPPAPDPVRLADEPRIKPTEAITYVGNILAFAAAGAAVAPVTRRFGAAYGSWIVVNIVPPILSHLFISLGRFTSVLFPVFFWLALRIPRDRLGHVALAFAIAQACLAVWFFLWRPVV
jgi:hypothetical protein